MNFKENSWLQKSILSFKSFYQQLYIWILSLMNLPNHYPDKEWMIAGTSYRRNGMIVRDAIEDIIL